MARLPRNVVPGLPQHVIQRGNNRQAVFFAEVDYRLYLDSLQQTAEQHDCAIHAYVLMTNHVHLLVTPNSDDGLSRLMQGVGRRYVRQINQLYRRSGTLWEGRFKSAVIDSDRYLLTCMHYIEMNPVRAGMVEEPHSYRWSSFESNATGRTNNMITPHPLYQALGRTDVERQAAYRLLFRAGIKSEDLGRICKATERGEIIGSERFRMQISEMLGHRVEKFTHGGDRKSQSFLNR